MLLKKYLNFEKNEKSIIILLLLISLAARIPAILILGDTKIENEWLHLLNNLINYNVLALQNFDGFLLPNLWMPPLYVYYLYILSLLNLDNQNFVLLVLFSQAILASISIVFFYKINNFFFSRNISFFSSLILSFIPIYLYACTQISSISLTIFLAIIFYYYFFKINKNKNHKYIYVFSIIAGLLILVRREFIVIFILTNLYMLVFQKISFKKSLLIFIITLITISPYLVRNYLIFDKIIIHSGFGFNLWKGNNPNSIVEGSEIVKNDFQNLIDKVPKDKFYRINEDKIYKDQAIKNIKEDPQKYIFLYFKRTLSFFFIDLESTKPNYYNPLHYIPLLILGFFSIIGILISDKRSFSFNYLVLLILFYIFSFSFFGILPRYRLYIIPIQIIFLSVLINYFVLKYNNYKK